MAATSEAAMTQDVEEFLHKVIAQCDKKPAGHFSLWNGETNSEVVLDLELDGFRYTLTRLHCPSAPSCITLSPREQEIVRLVTRGFSNKTIAAVLDISPWTVSTHLRRIFTKLVVSSRAEMVTKVLKEGLLQKTN